MVNSTPWSKNGNNSSPATGFGPLDLRQKTKIKTVFLKFLFIIDYYFFILILIPNYLLYLIFKELN